MLENFAIKVLKPNFYILTKRKYEKIYGYWKCVEKQTLPNIFTKDDAKIMVATQSFEGKEIKVDFEMIKISQGSVRHFNLGKGGNYGNDYVWGTGIRN